MASAQFASNNGVLEVGCKHKAMQEFAVFF